jgi:glycosyltransferase involved in cell wall biosynthesis
VDILVVANSCSSDKYEQICKMRKKATIDPQQKFFRLLVSGLKESNYGSVTVLSALPVSASTVQKKHFTLEDDRSEEGVLYRYLPFINGKIARYISLIFSARKYVKQWIKERNIEDSFVVVDPLIPVIAIPSRIVAQKRGIPVCAVVTDIPTLTTNMKGRRESLIKKSFLWAYQKIANNDLVSYDAYIPLTESINEYINRRGKPYSIVEGFADSRDTTVSTYHRRYVMYAGGVYEKYGIKNLVDAFLTLAIDDVDLYIFGDGPYVEEIKKIQGSYPRIKYMGCVSPEEVVRYEKEAMLLVNPRPTDEEFAKYSFPSKTMEYMLSGTPVVSTRLPGIPEEYFKYIYSFDTPDKCGIAKKLNELLSLPSDELINKGNEAHDFVLKNKNNVVMAKKIINLMSRGSNSDS